MERDGSLAKAGSGIAALALTFAIGAAPPPLPLAERELSRLGPVRVIVMFQELDEEQAEVLVQSTGKLALQTAAPTIVGGTVAAGSAAASYGATTVGSAVGATILPVAILVGIGGFAGSVQQRNRETAAARETTEPLRARFEAQLPMAEVERRFAAGLRDGLESSVGIQVAGAVEVRHLDRGTLNPWREALRSVPDDDRRSLLIVAVRSKLPLSLSALTMTASSRLYSVFAPPPPPRRYKWRKPPDPSVARDPDDWLDEPLRASALLSTVLTPVPLADLYQKPADWLERETREVNAFYDPLLADARDRDLRRELRTRRNGDLDEVRGPWRLLQLAEHMVEAWQGPAGPRYLEIVGPGVDAFGRAAALDLIAQPRAPAP